MLSRTAKYYRDNPEARKKHRKTSAKAQKKREAVKKRVECNKFNRNKQKVQKGRQDGLFSQTWRTFP